MVKSFYRSKNKARNLERVKKESTHEAIGDDGYLTFKGLAPLKGGERKSMRRTVSKSLN